MEGASPNTGNSDASGLRRAPQRLSNVSIGSSAGPSAQPSRSIIFGYSTTMDNTSRRASYSPHTRTSPQRASTQQNTETGEGSRRMSRIGTLPEHSRKYANAGRASSNTFLVPSYLKTSRYVAKLWTAHLAKSKAYREPSLSSDLSTSVASGATNTQRLAPSHRGMTYDIIESNPPKEEDEIIPLPSRWNHQDKYPGLELTNDGLDVKYSGSAPKAETEAASVRADYPMSPACGIYYFEVEIKQKSKDCAVAVGFSTQKASLERLPGWEADSWAYHGDDGRAFSGEHQGRTYGPTFAAGDTIGCGVNFVTGQAFFTRNGMDLGPAFRELKNVQPFPSIGIKKYSGAVVSVNFGQKPFLFDIDDRIAAERASVKEEINKVKTTALQPRLSEHALVQELVAQFLSHGGYVETSKAFAEQRQMERNALDEVPSPAESDMDHSKTHAVYRQQIRRAILDGNIDQALHLTSTQFPTVLGNSPEIAFRLKCRKWVELISQASDVRGRQHSHNESKQRMDNGFDQQMDVDEEQQHHTSVAGSKTSQPSADNDVLYNQLLTEAMNYGQVLQREYRDESSPEYRKTLADIFSLVAYNEPRDSVHGHLLDSDGRVKVAEELNSAILVTLGRSPTPALEKIYRQTNALIDVLSQEGGPACFLNLKTDFA